MSQPTAPAPTVLLEFHVEPHPDPVVQALIEEVTKLRAEKAALEERLEYIYKADPSWR